MSFISRLKACAKKTVVSRNAVFTYAVDKQKTYLSSFPEPHNAIDRSYFQYKCQMKLLGFWRSLLMRLSSPFVLLFLMFRDMTGQSMATADPCDAVFVSLGIPGSVIPESLKREFSRITTVETADLHRLDSDDRQFLRCVWKRHPFSLHFLLKIYLKVSMYSAWRSLYAPKAFIVCSEYSFTSSIMTEYCRRNNIQHINVMHGEKLFYIRDAFFEFDRCYVWDEFYKNLFMRLKAHEHQFIVEAPPSLCFQKQETAKEVDFTFYLGTEGEKELQKLAGYCERLQSLGYQVAVRPHPRYTDYSLLRLLPSEVVVEDGSALSVETSVLRTQHVVSLYSTVLNQALCNDVSIVIDDVTDPQKYETLRQLEFICLNKPHRLLSEILKEEHV